MNKMTENNESKEKTNVWISNEESIPLVSKGVPIMLVIWENILEYTMLYTLEIPKKCPSCQKAHHGESKKEYNRAGCVRLLLSICRSFNNLSVLRKYFCRISRFPGIPLKSVNPHQWRSVEEISWGNNGLISPMYITLMNLKSKSDKKVSERVSCITWLKTGSLIKGMVNWEYGKKLPIFFMAHLNYLMAEGGELFPELKIPMFSYELDRTPNAEYTFQHKMPKMTWKKTLSPNIKDEISIKVKGKYHFLVLGSPYNLFEIDNMDFFKTAKVEPIGKIEGKKVCFLVYRIRSLWRYRIFMKSDKLGTYPIYFRTNVL